MEAINTILYAGLMVLAAASIGAGVVLSKSREKIVGRVLYSVAAAAFAGGMLGLLSSSDVVKISSSVIGILAVAVFLVGVSGLSTVISFYHKEKLAVALSVVVLLGSMSFVAVMSVELGYDTITEEVTETCERSGTPDDICGRFAAEFREPNIAKSIFSKYEGSPEEARIMLTGPPLNADECQFVLRGLEPSDLSLKEALEKVVKTRTILTNDLYSKWCDAVEHATKDNDTTQSSNLNIKGCHKETENFAICKIDSQNGQDV